MAIQALKLFDYKHKEVLYSEALETLDGYGTGPVVYLEDVKTKLLRDDEFWIIRRLLSGVTWATVPVLKKESIAVKNYPPGTSLSAARTFRESDISDRFIANIPAPNEDAEHTLRWDTVSGIIELLGKEKY